MTIEQFGDALLKSGDLDPVYVALHKAQLPDPQLRRLCLAYFCLYHLGAAAKLSELKGAKYWDRLMEAAINKGDPKPWPRGAERRHWRGSQAIQSAMELAQRYKTPEEAVAGMFGHHPGPTYHLPFSAVSEAVQSHRGFGPWIAFKIADMGERLLGYPVDFEDCELGIYKDPRQGAAVAWVNLHRNLLWSREHNEQPWSYAITDAELREVVAHYVEHWRKAKAPPDNKRPIAINEVETILCKWKSHMKGNYKVGKDIREIRHGLVGWGDTAQELLKHMPPEVA